MKYLVSQKIIWMTLLLVQSPFLLAEEKENDKVEKAKTSRNITITNVLGDEIKLTDPRNAKLRHTRDKFHPWTPSETLSEWEKESELIKKQILVSNGLWPMPPQVPLNPVVYGKIDRGDYTIEKVFFASHPGHYVTGNLYKPKNITGQVPGILSPHGHYPNGRFYELRNDKKIKNLIAGAGEKFVCGAKFPVQARMVQLARMGCIVFHYDMVGYADSKQINHTEGFRSVAAGLRLQNFMGLQTFNSIRALDFLTSLAEVDQNRVAVTGSSGGGTQTFLLCAIDDRPAVAFPAVMVSTGMQGGCICENASYLRVGINNVALAATFAPKPMAMTGADDWTKEIETKGYPELQKIYGFFGKTEDVYAKAFPQYGHNYNQVSRTVMYQWMKKYLKLDESVSTEEKEFEPLSIQQMTVFSDDHQLPDDAVSSDELRQYLSKTSQEKYEKIIPDSEEDFKGYRNIVETAAKVMLSIGVPEGELVESKMDEPKLLGDGIVLVNGAILRKDSKQQILYSFLVKREGFQNTVNIWLEDEGKSCLFLDDKTVRPEIKKLLQDGQAVMSIDLYLTGEWLSEKSLKELYPVDEKYNGYTYCLNRPILSSRVNDVLNVIAGLYKKDFIYEINLVGMGKAGVTALLARGLARKYITRTVVSVDGYNFQGIQSASDELYLPGALKYGGIGGLGALVAPNLLVIGGTEIIPDNEMSPLRKVYSLYKGKLVEKSKSLSRSEIVDMLLDK